ncbi:hypothetical protein LSAT2_003963 [Lamellibrachia satsuma]|nr:hypothetical protein LSAT2_003963 [Lamellibrachia satsuma]
MRRTLLTLLGLVCVFLAIQSRPTVTVPSTGNCVRCRGMSCDQWQRVQLKMRQLTASAAASDGLQFDVQEDNQTNINSGDNYFGDILLTEEQVDELLELQEEKLQEEELQNEKLHKEKFFRGDEQRRQKRALRKSASTRWSLPIHWKFDGNHSE